MNTELLTKILNLIMPVSSALEQQLITLLKEEHFPRKHLLLREGDISRKIYFINAGFARAYYFTAEGRECTSWFMGRGDFMISVYSFYTQQPARENIELLANSELLSITWNQLHSLYADHPEFNFIGRLLTEKYYIKAEERAIILRTLTARERYVRLIESFPEVLQQASLGQIASHLNMSQETLSRVRARASV